MGLSIFISKELEELTMLPEFCEKNSVKLSCKSLIQFKSMPFEIKNDYSVLFFSSIRSFDHFTKYQQIQPNVALATIGQATARRIKQRGFTVDFIGDKAGHPHEVANEFKEWLGNRKVLIPISKQSNRTISNALELRQFEEVEVYETGANPAIIDAHEVYVFTSPSNIASYFSMNKIPIDAKVIAWGVTSDEALKRHNVRSTHVLSKASEEELIHYLTGLLF